MKGWFALGWALLWGWVLPQTPLVKVDWAMGDLFVRGLPAPPPPTLGIVVFQAQNALLDRPNYADRVAQLLASGARGVVLNLPVDFSLPLQLPGRLPLPLAPACFSALQTNLDCPLELVIAQAYPRLILVTTADPEVYLYNHVQSFSEDGKRYRYPLETLLAVAEPTDSDGVLRTLPPTGPYPAPTAIQPGMLTLSAVSRLAAEKWGKTELPPQALGLRLGFTEPRVMACPGQGLCPQVKGQIVILGSLDEQVQTPWGKLAQLMAQGQSIAAGLGGYYYRRLDGWPATGLIFLLTLAALAGLEYLKARPWWLVLGGGLTAWFGLVILSLMLGMLLPSFLMLGALISLQLSHYALETTSQLERLRRAERQAILSQARKLLYRVATDIHDQQLQQLKVVMDNLESSLHQPQSQVIDQSLDQLQAIGLGIRNELGNLRTLADKLEITPQLKQGLAQGIQALVAETPDQRIAIQLDLQPLREPLDQSQWLDNREDIFRFFREAYTNALRHGKTATYVAITLEKTSTGARITVENDGVPQPLPPESGYGTKAMNTISRSLPGGRWAREWLPGGKVRVTLAWSMSYHTI